MPASRAAVTRARGLRRQMSLPERVLWRILQARPGGFKFRRQHPIGPYVLDFYCREAALAVEVDGISHDMGDNPQRDERRDAWLAGQGVKTMRLAATDVLRETEGAVLLILGTCEERAP